MSSQQVPDGENQEVKFAFPKRRPEFWVPRVVSLPSVASTSYPGHFWI